MSARAANGSASFDEVSKDRFSVIKAEESRIALWLQVLSERGENLTVKVVVRIVMETSEVVDYAPEAGDATWEDVGEKKKRQIFLSSLSHFPYLGPKSSSLSLCLIFPISDRTSLHLFLSLSHFPSYFPSLLSLPTIPITTSSSSSSLGPNHCLSRTEPPTGALTKKKNGAKVNLKIYASSSSFSSPFQFSFQNLTKAPRTSRGNILKSSEGSNGNSPSASPWGSIIDNLNGLLCTLRENFVPPVLAQKIFSQVFTYINVQLFNSLLLRRECFTFSNGEYVKSVCGLVLG
ncbi:myosin-7-like [Humulus lupulus]|uniref:myosin-7-like n=1 Tax=Humulus lupulus TaxID=3486 RepID=UPI002B40AF9F|nr:myosin-7-like [Humulus lupulus]